MAEKERLKAEPIKAVVEFRATPEIERAIAEQMRALPQAMKQFDGKYSWSCFGLIGCCNGSAVAFEPAS